jgi:hypothetical protein
LILIVSIADVREVLLNTPSIQKEKKNGNPSPHMFSLISKYIKAFVGVLYLDTAGRLLQPTNLDTARFPLAVNGWGTKYSVPDITPPHLAGGEESST